MELIKFLGKRTEYEWVDKENIGNGIDKLMNLRRNCYQLMCYLFVFAVVVASGCVNEIHLSNAVPDEWRIMDITMKAFSIDASDREIVAKWQYIVVRAVRQCVPFDLLCWPTLAFLPKRIYLFRFILFLSSSLSSFHSFFFLYSISWRLDNAEIRVRLSLADTRSYMQRSSSSHCFLSLMRTSIIPQCPGCTITSLNGFRRVDFGKEIIFRVAFIERVSCTMHHSM